MAAHYFKDLFTTSNPITIEEVSKIIENRIDQNISTFLNMPFTALEIREALFQIGLTKSSGPYGIPALFYQKYWHMVGEEVARATLNILNGNDSFLEINHTYIVFIPKIKAPQNLPHFRPISFCNVIYKMVSKVLANRIKVVLPNLISESQSTFVNNRLLISPILPHL